MADGIDACILISAGAEWRSFLPHFDHAKLTTAPYGDYFRERVHEHRIVIFHGGSGKVAAAG